MDIKAKLKALLENLDESYERKGVVNRSDLNEIIVWQELLYAKRDAERERSAKPVNPKNDD
tara:strand:- start:375 stop:557 length:183 start_codon:yes stop_codon:yes gene_type:complete